MRRKVNAGALVSQDRLDIEVTGRGGALVLRPRGLLCSATYSRMLDVLFRSVLAEPVAVVVDLSALRTDERAEGVFLAVRAQIVDWPGVPLLLAAGPPEPWNRPGHPSVAAALASVGEQRARRTPRLPLPVGSSAAVIARLLAEETCLQWGLDAAVDAVAEVSGAMCELVRRVPEARVSIGFTLRGTRLTVALSADVEIPCDHRDVRRALAGARALLPRGGWSTTWSGGSVLWVVLTT
ncbi:hypothetical protein [Saccharothrix coeruleofusca]|uniref:STAS domain-containing protein n=1 Tax=Saccharothrix coeruleofusca TaxID=33919 RepID=A0A918AKX3_9PSEU|nr:hypothetical protein [Saccharothrix coeruleofusca]GGP52072.1 hypothetical protein GCM10010185_25180 [Saccharothrix coeruleofusca]